MGGDVGGEHDRKDVVWQRPSVVATYRLARRGIPFADVHFDIVRRVIQAHGLDVRRVLDLGSGDGMATSALVDRYPVEHAVLVDFSEPMLQEARRNFDGSDLAVDFVWGDLLGSQWRASVETGGPFDLVISRFAIHHLPDGRKKSLYREILDLLRPGGLFIHIEHVRSLSPVYERAFYRSVADGIYRAESGNRSVEEIEAVYMHPDERAVNILAPVDDQLSWLREAGFIDVDCLFKAFELAVFAGRRP